ncbi:hypothetical protein DL89DRAFT_3516 [Linderina pennispora]|uniref:Uncharacterized protein n=1 Tax=Linderina pennispora TaxID=61395 RepID=A0A1Y1WKN0_9FUNG|nr:uncharacterized protein DL89DRAFT_3516 [Linderina pennispora]ORX73756.1 hypothetical protein DL89DRAFT_3516 [Linderina pennispora]
MPPFSPPLGRKPLALAAAGLAAISLGQLASLASTAARDRDRLCDGKTWSWSLHSDCFRFGVLLPSITLLITAAGSALAVVKPIVQKLGRS